MPDLLKYKSPPPPPQIPFKNIIIITLNNCWSKSDTGSLAKAHIIISTAGEEGQDKPFLSGRESHTARQRKSIALQAKPIQSIFSPSLIPYSLPARYQNFQQMHELKSSSIALPLCSRHSVHKIVSSAGQSVRKRSCAPLMTPPSDSF